DAGVGSRHGRATPRPHQGQRAGARAEDLVRHARLRQGRQGRLLLPKRREVQGEIRDVRLQRQGEPRSGRDVAYLLRAQGAGHGRGEKDRRAPEESVALRSYFFFFGGFAGAWFGSATTVAE